MLFGLCKKKEAKKPTDCDLNNPLQKSPPSLRFDLLHRLAALLQLDPTPENYHKIVAFLQSDVDPQRGFYYYFSFFLYPSFFLFPCCDIDWELDYARSSVTVRVYESKLDQNRPGGSSVLMEETAEKKKERLRRPWNSCVVGQIRERKLWGASGTSLVKKERIFVLHANPRVLDYQVLASVTAICNSENMDRPRFLGISNTGWEPEPLL